MADWPRSTAGVAAGRTGTGRRDAGLVVAGVAASLLAVTLYARVDGLWWLLGWVGLVPWLGALERTRSVRGTLAAGLLMSVGFAVTIFGGFAASIQSYTGTSRGAALLVLVLLAPLLEPQLVVFPLARFAARAAGAARWRVALIGAGAYVGSEWATPKLFADTLGHGLYASALLRQAADLAGASGLTFVLIVVNECVLAVAQALLGGVAVGRISPALKAATAPAAGVILLLGGLFAYGGWRYRQFADATAGPALTVGMVQADISHYDRLRADLGTFEAVRRILDTHFTMSNGLLASQRIDLLVWPETVYPTTFGSPKSADGAAFDRQIGAFVTRAGVPLVFGAYDSDGGSEYNAAIFLEPAGADGKVRFEAYRKQSLFPLTERVPALLESSLLRRWLPWLGTWRPGTGPAVLPLTVAGGRTVSVAPLICYDAVVPDHAIAAVRQGADLILTLSNDSWFAPALARWHLVVAAFRSIETRRPQVRATNTGVSAVITAAGDFHGTIGFDQRATLVGAVVPEAHAWTLMLAWGDWGGPVAGAGAVALLVLPWVRRALRRLRRRRALPAPAAVRPRRRVAS